MAENKKISELEKLVYLTGDEMIPVAKDGKNYSITPEQIAHLVDVENIPNLETINGKENVIVYKDGEKYMARIFNIGMYIQNAKFDYLEIDINSLPRVNGNFENKNWANDDRYRCVFINRETIHSNKIRFVANSWKISFAFLTDTPSIDNNNYCLGTSVTTLNAIADSIADIPDDCTLIYVYVGNDTVTDGIHVYEVVDPQYEEKLDELNERVNRLEQSAIAPASLDSVSRDEFDALKAELDLLKSRI